MKSLMSMIVIILTLAAACTDMPGELESALNGEDEQHQDDEQYQDEGQYRDEGQYQEIDQDNDGYTQETDCDDSNFEINPGAAEVSGNEIDENCDGIVHCFSISELGMQFVHIPAGTFQMGSPPDELGRDSDETLHEVTLTRPFCMQTTEVTQNQWRHVASNTDDEQLNNIDMVNPSRFQYCGDECPVEQVSWEDIQRFITAINNQYGQADCQFRLPTETEWEYAARGDSDTAFANGDIKEYNDMDLSNDDPNLDAMGWYHYNADVSYSNDCHFNEESRCMGPNWVGLKIPNAYGLYDMHGNVYEWCNNWYGRYSTDPLGPSSGEHRVLRGGSWYSPAKHCRSAFRNHDVPDFRYYLYGFRLVCASADE